MTGWKSLIHSNFNSSQHYNCEDTGEKGWYECWYVRDTLDLDLDLWSVLTLFFIPYVLLVHLYLCLLEYLSHGVLCWPFLFCVGLCCVVLRALLHYLSEWVSEWMSEWVTEWMSDIREDSSCRWQVPDKYVWKGTQTDRQSGIQLNWKMHRVTDNQTDNQTYLSH